MTGEDHYPHKDQLTKAQLDKVAELRQRAAATLALYPGYDTDFSLLRWLMGWDYDIETILPKIQNAIEVQTALGLHNEPSVDITEINDFVKSQSSVSEYFPGGIMGTDRDGNILMMEALARTHPKSLAKTRPVSELFRICASESDAAFKVIRQQEALTGRKLGVKIVIDLDGFNMDLIYTPTLKVYLNLLVLLQAVYPDFARKIYVINCPMMIQTVYALIQPALSKQTREKVSFLGKDWKAKLIEDFGEENIYKHWGGTKEHPNGKPSGDLRMGGKVPEKEWYNADTNPFDIDEGVVKVNVGARGKKEIKVQGKKDKTLRWAFRCSSGDIDFGVYKNGRQVWPKFRVTTEFVPELGQLKLSEDGEYTILFDNSHGKVWSKDIKYRVTVE